MLLIVAGTGLGSPCPAESGGLTMKRALLASAIRESGFSCARIVDVRRAPEKVPKGEIVWVVRCDGASYTVRHGPTGVLDVTDRNGPTQPAETASE